MSLAASNTPLLVARLRAGQIGVAFIRPPISDSDGLALDLLVDEPAIMVLPTGHRLCWAASAPLSALAEETFVLCARELNPGNYDSIIAACHRADLLKYRPEVTMQGRLIYPHVSCMAREVSMTTSPCFPPAIAGSPSRGAMHFRQAAASLRRDRVQPFGHGSLVPAAAQPSLQAIEIKIDHRGRVEGQELAERQAADRGVAERLAQLRAGAGAERER
jgi:hypothetical protein